MLGNDCRLVQQALPDRLSEQAGKWGKSDSSGRAPGVTIVGKCRLYEHEPSVLEFYMCNTKLCQRQTSSQPLITSSPPLGWLYSFLFPGTTPPMHALSLCYVSCASLGLLWTSHKSDSPVWLPEALWEWRYTGLPLAFIYAHLNSNQRAPGIVSCLAGAVAGDEEVDMADG